MAERACQDCHLITEERPCPACRSDDLSDDWTGSVLVVEADESLIAEKMNIESPGRYALKVR